MTPTQSWYGLAGSLAMLLALAAVPAAPAQPAPQTSPAQQVTKLNLPIAPGPFQPTMESLKNYECPEWFRDAKFGIWAHWGPQSVPMMGDWYAQRMYKQGDQDYNDHLARFGHPSVAGYKDIIPLWKAEKWDPDKLMALYKRAGAKYFVSMGTHHDNFFLWDSKLHEWNSVKMGPKRDVVGEWQAAAKKYGLKFGVSEHLAASFTWFQASHGSDRTGPKAGVPYDGADPKYWSLYHFPAEPGDRGWNSNNPKWQQQWFNEIKELVDNYHPDLLYSDSPVPFSNEVGRSMIAHLYNASAAAHDGKTQVVYNCKQQSDGRWVQDLERGIMPRIDPYPWQTDTSIGDWFYNKNWKFRPVTWVIHMLVDNVSKNGNLLLNVVQRPDGSLDPEVIQMLEDLAKWTAVHGEAIYGTRPWQVYGESAVRVRGGAFGEDYTYNAREIRFTTKGATLYALALGWPEDGKIVVRSLARPAGQNVNNITGISLLGSAAKLTWKQDADGLVVTLPAQKVSEYTTGLKIEGTGLKAMPFTLPPPVLSPNANGVMTLGADDAILHGQLKTQAQGRGGSVISSWDNVGDWAAWKVNFPKAGAFSVSVSATTAGDGSEVVVEVADQKVEGKVVRASNAPAGAGQRGAVGRGAGARGAGGRGFGFRVPPIQLGRVEIKQAGPQEVKIRPKNPAQWTAINLREVRFTAVAQ